jgi:hypothetical protein
MKTHINCASRLSSSVREREREEAETASERDTYDVVLMTSITESIYTKAKPADFVPFVCVCVARRRQRERFLFGQF